MEAQTRYAAELHGGLCGCKPLKLVVELVGECCHVGVSEFEGIMLQSVFRGFGVSRCFCDYLCLLCLHPTTMMLTRCAAELYGGLCGCFALYDGSSFSGAGVLGESIVF